ncbi:MAG: membrane dipeptidase [Anaerolineaceae bacterium]|nr:membrane dipeptidase [Anaerolineaceae bacterium]
MKIKPEKAIGAITHDHSMYGLAARRTRGERAVFSRHYAPLFRQGGVNVIGWVVGGDPPFFAIENNNPWWGSLELLDMLWQEAEESHDTLAICRNFQEIDNALAEDKIAIFITMEGAAALGEGLYPESLINLRTLYRLGLRSLQIVGQDWNQLIDVAEKHPHPSKGLTSFGKSVVREMNRLGMVIDLSHIPDPDPVFEDILEISQHPVIDSHRGVRSVTDIPRNISDERIKAIAQTGGVVGLQFFSMVLSNKPDYQATTDDLIRHIDHIVDIAGVDHVSLGPDFLESNLINRNPGYYVRGIEEIENLTRAKDALVNHGYSDEDIRKIMGENILRVYQQVIG